MKKLLFFVALVANSAFGQSVLGETELAGFVLGQYRTAVQNELGTPIEKRISSEGWILEFYKLTPDTSVYALFKYPSWDTTRVYAIQINGDKYDPMHSFHGVKLGSPKAKVLQVFGPESRVETLDDPPLNILYYDHRNYSFEINKSDEKLSGIQIYGSILEVAAPTHQPSLIDFKSAVLSKNVDSLLANISPSAEFYVADKVIRYQGGARQEFSKAESEFKNLLLADNSSVWAAFEVERAKAHAEKRPYNDKGDMATVFKFTESQILDEIVFRPHAGKWKVYEVRFKSVQ